MRERTRILFVTGDGQGGQGKASLNLVAENEAIEIAIQGSKHRDEFELCHPIYETKRYGLVGRLARHRPQIVHFGGHGVDRRLLLTDELGPIQISAEEAKRLFCSDSPPRLVVLSACHSLEVAKQLRECVEFSIGTEGKLGDSASLAFARVFYQCIGNGLSLKDAHEWAVKAIAPEPPEDQSPKLLCRPGADAAACRFAPQPLDPIEPFLACSYWIRKIQEHSSADMLSDRQVAEILVYSLQPALYLGMLRPLKAAAERLERTDPSAELMSAQRLVKWVVAFNEETRIRPRRPRLRELIDIRDGLTDDWTVPDKNGAMLSKWLEVQRADWLGLTHQRIGMRRGASRAKSDFAKARDSFEAAASHLEMIPPDSRDPVRVLWGGFIAFNLARILISLKQIPIAREQMSDAERFRKAAKARFADYPIEPEMAEQLHLEVFLAQLGRLELGARETEDGPTDEELWRDIVKPLKAKRDHWKGIWKYVFGEVTKVANVRGWDSSQLKALHDQADHSRL